MKSLARHFLPSFLLAAVFVLLFHFEPFSAPNAERDGFLFEVRASAEKAAPLRLYADQGLGFILPHSTVSAVSAAPEQTVRFLLPPGTFRAFRLEGEAGFSGLSLYAARVVDLEGKLKAGFSPLQFQAKLAADKVEQRDGSARVTHGAVLVIPSPLRLAPPIAWSEILLELMLATVIGMLVLWKLGPRIDAGLASAWRTVRDFSSPRPVLTLFLVAAGAVAVACHPVIFQGKSYVSPNNFALTLSGQLGPGTVEDGRGSDTGAVMWAHLPYSVVQHRAIFHDHEWPLWNRYNTCGTPLLGQGQSMLGDPLHWLAIAAGGAAWSWDAKMILSRILFTFGIGLLVRSATGRLWVAALLGASSAFIGFFSYRLNHPACFSLGYAPWILFAWWQIARASSWRASVPFALLLLVANWCELHSGTAKEAAILIAGLNATGALLVALLETTFRRRLAKLTLGAGALGLFFLLSAPGWLIFLDALARAYTSYGKVLTFQISPAFLLGLFDDLFYRQTVPHELHGNPAANFLVLIGVLWAFASRRLRADGGWRALVLAILPVFAFAFGLLPPVLIEKLPFLRNISHIDNTFSCVLIVLLFPLAGLGWQACVEGRGVAKWRHEFWLVLLFAALLAALFFGHTQAFPRMASLLSDVPRYPAKSGFFLAYAAALFTALIVLPWAFRSLGRSVTVSSLLVAILGLATIHFRQAAYGETKFDAYVANLGFRTDLLETTPALVALRSAQVDPERVLGFGMVLAPGFAGALGLESPASADALLSPFWREYIEAAGVPRIWDWRVAVTKESMATQLRFLDFMNVRHYLARPGEASPTPPGLRSIATADLEVLESPTAWPRAFFTDALPRYRDVQDFVQFVAGGDGRPFAAVAEGEGAAPILPVDLAARRVEPAAHYRLTNNTTEFTVDASAAGVALLSEAHDARCFRVTVNGQPATPFRANHLFHAVALPRAGRYVVRFTYEPPVWKTSLALAATGGVLLIAALAALALTRPRTAGA